jgi:hypothetical protein
MAQGVLPFKYEEEKKTTGMTALAGLPVYLDLVQKDRAYKINPETSRSARRWTGLDRQSDSNSPDTAKSGRRGLRR